MLTSRKRIKCGSATPAQEGPIARATESLRRSLYRGEAPLRRDMSNQRRTEKEIKVCPWKAAVEVPRTRPIHVGRGEVQRANDDERKIQGSDEASQGLS